MKSYTDLEQSEKLAEFLPIESADMVYQKIFDKNHMIYDYRAEIIPYRFYSGIGVPCWSLAALFDVLPKETRLLKSATDDTYHCDCPKGNIDKWFGNPVDACVVMIEKLKEKNLL